MLVIPVIDIKDGRCVKLVKGLNDKTEYYCRSTINIAKLFRKENFKALHVTDLNGAIDGQIKNLDFLRSITTSIDVPVQFGGGINDFETGAKILKEYGAYRIIIGTVALESPDLIKDLIKEFSASKIICAIDEKSGKVVKDGWHDKTDIDPLEYAMYLKNLGVKRIIYQDVTRVGHFMGPNIDRLYNIAEKTQLRITAGGGIRGYLDLRDIMVIERFGIDSVMISSALYENRFPCQAIWRDSECKDTNLELPLVGNIQTESPC